MYIHMRAKKFKNIKETSMSAIGKVVVRTQKIPNKLVDGKVLDLIDRIIGEYADSHISMTITEVSRILQTAQVCYDEETNKERPRSEWNANIENRIWVLKLSKDTLEKARRKEKLPFSKPRIIRKIIREFNFNSSNLNDISEA